jgi:hypothetical protein
MTLQWHKVWIDSNSEDDGESLPAHNPQDAVERFAREANLPDTGEAFSVKVRSPFSGDVSEWLVSGETLTIYSARLKVAG